MKQIILIACPGTCQTDDDENKNFLATNYKNDGQLMFKSMQICVYNFFSPQSSITKLIFHTKINI